jgi:hypothetical protein
MLVGGMALYAALVVPLAPALRSPATVDQVTIRNPHPWKVNVDVSGEPDGGWVGIGSIARDDDQRFEEVLDQGGRWRFAFDYAGTDGGELVLDRADLEASGWQLTVPEEVAVRMEAGGLEPSPPR